MADIQKYKDAGEEVLGRVKTIIAETDGWAVGVDANGILGTNKAMEGSPINCYRGKTKIANYTPTALIDMLWSRTTKEQWCQHDPNIIEWKVLKQLDDVTRIIYQANKLTWPIWNRDSVMVQMRKEVDGTQFLVWKSVVFEGMPERESEKFIRASVNTSAYVFEKDPENPKGAIAHRVVHVDPRGTIPSMVVNANARNVYYFAEPLVKAADAASK